MPVLLSNPDRFRLMPGVKIGEIKGLSDNYLFLLSYWNRALIGS